jgi:hypothetical protein
MRAVDGVALLDSVALEWLRGEPSSAIFPVGVGIAPHTAKNLDLSAMGASVTVNLGPPSLV